MTISPSTFSNTGTINATNGTLNLSSSPTGGSVNISSGTNLTIAGITYAVINNLGSAGSATGTDLQGMNGNLSGHFALGSNIDASATSSWDSGAGFMPIGNSTTKFTGTFDGLGHTISNLTINRPTGSTVGPFGYTFTGSVIKNVGLVGGSVTGGSNNVGGLVGWNYGTVSNSYATGNVIGGANSVGGLVGANYGTVSNSYATGNASGPYVGGLVGWNKGTISNSYSTGSVSGSASGGLLGASNGGTVTNSYWNTTTSGITSSSGGTGLTTAQMETMSSFSGWNISNTGGSGDVWRIYQGSTTPLLTSFLTPLTVTANAASKSYDGTAYSGGNGVTYSITPNSNLLGTVSYSGTSQGATSAGSYTIIPSGLYSSQQGYDISYVNGSLAINSAILTINLNGTRVYDGTTNLASSIFTLSGLVGGQTLNLSGTGTMSNANVGTNKPVSLGTLALGNGTGLASNYTLSGGTDQVTITPAPLTITAATNSRTYNGTTSSTATPTVSGLLGSDTASSLTEAFGSKNVLGTNGSTLNVAGYTLNDGYGGANYSVSTVSATGTITPLAVMLTAPSVSKTYDGLLTYTTSAGNLTSLATPLMGGDTVTAATIAYANKDAGTNNKTVSLSGVTINDGNSGANYTVTVAGNNTSTITPATLTVTNLSGTNQTYNGTTVDALTGTASLNGLVGGESFALNGTATGTLANKNAGSEGVTTSLTLGTASGGAVAGDYTLVQPTLANVTIAQAPLTITAASDTKTYNGNTLSTATPTVTSGTVFSGDTLPALTQVFNGQNVSGTTLVTPNSVTVSDGNNGGNYYVTLVTAAGSITQKTLTVTGLSGTDRIYNGSTVNVLSGTASLSGLVGNETLTIGGTTNGTLASANAGSRAVTTSVTLADNGSYLASNYTLTQATLSNVTISPAALTVSTSNVTKTYDGTTTAAGTPIVTSGTLYTNASNGNVLDSLSGGTYAFTDSNVGGGNKNVTVTGVMVTDGNSGGNYAVSYVNNTSSTINQLASLAYTGTSGNWSNASNWAGGILPTGANVAAVTIPSGVTVTYDSGVAGTTTLNSLTSSGNLTMAAGTLTTSGNFSTTGYSQTGGALSVGGNLTVMQSFAQSAGSLVMAGGSITQATGDLLIGGGISWAANKLTLNAYNNININANLNASGTASLALIYGQGAVASGNTSNIITNGAVVSLPAGTTNFTTLQGSDGTVKNYTVITNLGAAGSVTHTDLQGMNGGLALNYALGADIDATATSGWNTGAGFLPITSFSGTLDGLGHTISNLFINRPTANYVGLIRAAQNGVSVSNLGLVGESVNGKNYVGGLVGYSSGTISNSYSSGSVSGLSYIGGLVGNNNSTISNSYSSSTVSGTSTIGGLVGMNDGTISNSYSNGTVSGTSTIGGLVGSNYVTISNSYSSGTVSGTSTIGGLVGMNGGTISNSYSSGAVNGSSYVGGLVGSNYNKTSFEGYGYGTLNNSHYNIDSVAINNVTGTYVTQGGLFNAQYQDWSSHGMTLNIANYASLAGSGNNYSISSVQGMKDLLGFADNSAYTFSLSNDIDLSTAHNLYIPYLEASFDGAGHTISNLNINQPFSSRLGLFGYAYGNNISNLGLLNVTIIGKNDVGGLVGYSSGTISNSYSSGAVSGSSYVGGLVGNNNGGTISNSYSSGSVSGSSNVGGLVGSNYGTLNNSHYNIDSVAINNVTGTYVTQGGLYNAQYQDWSSNSMMLNIANYASLAGSGISNNYLISSVQGMKDLLGFADNPAYTFSLTNNIDLSAAHNLYIPYLAASFDGAGYTISNLNINQPFSSRLGLFGYTNGNSAISNLGLLNVTVSGNNYVGGLVGENYSIINNSYSSGSISGLSYVGGLVGDNNSSIRNSYSSSAVSGLSYVGGLAGNNSYYIYCTYATGATSGTTIVGGLVGENDGTINNTYATGTTTGTTNVGGLIGFSNGIINSSYWNSTVKATGIGGGTSSAQLMNVFGLTTSQMQTASNFVSSDVIDNWYDNWVIVDANGTLNNAAGASGATFPMLASEYSTTINNAHQLQLMAMNLSANYTLGQNINALATGNGTDVWGSAGFVPIGNANSPFTGSFDGLGQTISGLTINQPTANSIGLFGVVGNATSGTVSNVSLLNPIITGQTYVGGIIGLNANGTLNNSSVIGGTISGTNYVGGLVGYNDAVAGSSPPPPPPPEYGIINNSFTTGVTMKGTSYIGGLVGENGTSGTINSSYSNSTANGSGSYVGGLVGANFNTITNSYSTGVVTGTHDSIGGLAGSNSGSISNSYAAGSISGSTNVGELVGANSGTFTRSFWNSSIRSVGIGSDTTIGATSGALGLSTADMMQLASFTGWSIANTGGAGMIWRIYQGDTAPLLTSFLTPLTLTGAAASDTTLTYNSSSQSATGYSGSVLYGANTSINGLSIASQTNAGSYSGYYSSQQGYDITGGNLVITPANLSITVSVTGTTVSDKVYDGTFNAVLTGGTMVGLVGSDIGSTNGGNASLIVLNQSGIFASKNAGTGISVTANDSLTGADAGNYILSQPTGLSGNITQKTLTVTGLSSHPQTYNGTNVDALSGTATLNGLVGSETFALNGSTGLTGTLASKNAGSESVTANLSLGTGTNGASAGNYTLTQPSLANVTIAQAPLTITATADTKTYNGNTLSTATPTVTSGTVFSGDTLPALTQVFNGTTVLGTWQVEVAPNSVTVSDGNNGGNYYVTLMTAAGSITPKTLTVTGLSSTNQTYNGTNIDALSGTATLSGLVGSETFALNGSTGLTGTLASKNAGTEAVTASLALGTASNGANLRNYTLTQPTLSNVTIAQAPLTISAISDTKTYNGLTTSSATPTVTSGTVFSGDTLTGLTQSFASKNVAGTNESILNVGGYTLSDSNGGGNYNVTLTTATGTITPATLTVTNLSGTNQIYNGTTIDALTGIATLNGLVGGESFTLNGTATGTLVSKNAGSEGVSALLSLGTASGGAWAGNYTLLQPTLTNVTIAQAPLTITATNDTRTYNGLTTSSATPTVTSGTVFSGDTLTGLTQSFASKNVSGANGSILNVNSGYTLNDGKSGGNYSVMLVTTTGTIIPATLTASIATGSSVYGSALVTGAATITSGLVSGDHVSLGAVAVNTAGHTSSSGKLNAGTFTGIESVGNSLSGSDAGNYTFAGATGNYTVSQLTLTGSIATGSSVYGLTLMPGAVTFTNAISGDNLGTTTVSVNSTGLLSTSNHLTAGTHNGIETVSGLSGSDAGNYAYSGITAGNYTVTPLALTGSIAAGNSVYGSALIPGAASFSGVVAGDAVTLGTVTVNTTGHTSTSGKLNAGSYTGIQSANSLSGADAGNYSFAGVTGNYTVTPLALTGSITTGNSVYGSVLTPGAASFSGVVSGDAVTLGTVIINTASHTSTSGNLNAGSYTGIQSASSLSGADAGNYSFAGITGNYTVTPLALTG